MRVFAISDVHLEFAENARWLEDVSRADFLDDVLILGGDVAEETALLARGLRAFVKCFRTVLYVPGNHELWITGSDGHLNSLEKFAQVCAITADCGASTAPMHDGAVSIVPLLSWYDFSFGEPSTDLLARWVDFRACRWPGGADASAINEQFLARNGPVESAMPGTVISFSHFLPRIDVMPPDVPTEQRMLYPVLGTMSLERHIRRLRSAVHVYGHSHLNRDVMLDDVRYINNALGYPGEEHIASRDLLCIYNTE